MTVETRTLRSTARGLLAVEDLRVTDIRTGHEIVRGVGFELDLGQTVALVGESGSGKSLTAKSLMGLLPDGLEATGRMHFADRGDLEIADRASMTQVRGSGIGMLLQDPFTMLNPLVRIGVTMTETLRSKQSLEGASRKSLRADAENRLAEVGIDQPGVLQKYPWELSGGMRQRVGIAASIAKDPAVLIIDEPTTALDATTQREVLRLIRSVQMQRGMGLVLITHEMRVAFSMSDRIHVMRKGQVVDVGLPATLESSATSEYTRSLLAADLPLNRRLDVLVREDAVPAVDENAHHAGLSVEGETGRGPDEQALVVRDLRKSFGHGKSEVQILHGVALEMPRGTSVGVIGESGSGKTTLARCLLGLEQATSGTILLGGSDVTDRGALSRGEAATLRSRIQCVFQDPYSSLNPSHTIEYALREAILLRSGGAPRKNEISATVAELLTSVGLSPDLADVHPASLSGGQRQRVAIARALAMRPEILICDEPVAALDLSVQALVLQVLRTAQARGIQLLFITHDLPVVRQMTDEVVVLLKGEVVERGPTGDVLDNPQHPYTRRLVNAVPTGAKNWLDDVSTPPVDQRIELVER